MQFGVVLFLTKTMFAMKRVILAAALVVAISGFAAAQSTSAKTTSNKNEKAVVKKDTKNTSKNTVLKQETSANAKADSTVKVVLPLPKPIDTSSMPPVKKNDEQF